MCDKYILRPATGILAGNGKALECSKKFDSVSPHSWLYWSPGSIVFPSLSWTWGISVYLEDEWKAGKQTRGEQKRQGISLLSESKIRFHDLS